MSVKAASLLILTIAAYSFPANAQQAAVYKDSNGAIFLYGLQPGSVLTIDITKPSERAVLANSCGVVLVRSSDIFNVTGQTVDPNSNNLTTRELPKTCAELVGYPAFFKTGGGAIAITGKSPGFAHTIILPNHKTTRRLTANDCGFVRLSGDQATTLNLPTITGGRANFTPANFIQAKPLVCVKGTFYIPAGFDLKTAVASASVAATTGTNSGGSTGSTGGTNSQSAQPVAAKSGNKLIISSIPPGTYTVSNTANPQQSKVHTVTNKACLVSDRTQIGSPSNFLVSRQGLIFPVSWAALTEIPAAAIPSC